MNKKYLEGLTYIGYQEIEGFDSSAFNMTHINAIMEILKARVCKINTINICTGSYTIKHLIERQPEAKAEP